MLVLPRLFAFLCVASVLSCATKGSGPSPGASATASSTDARVELVNTKWGLLTTNGSRDGRVIQFQKADNGEYHGLLIRLGQILPTTVGAYEGAVLMELTPGPTPNLYKGISRRPGKDYTEATFSVSRDGETLKSSVDDSPWMRVR